MMNDTEYLEKCCYPLVLCNEELKHNERLRSISEKLARYEKALQFYADENNYRSDGSLRDEPEGSGKIAKEALEDK